MSLALVAEAGSQRVQRYARGDSKCILVTQKCALGQEDERCVKQPPMQAAIGCARLLRGEA